MKPDEAFKWHQTIARHLRDSKIAVEALVASDLEISRELLKSIRPRAVMQHHNETFTLASCKSHRDIQRYARHIAVIELDLAATYMAHRNLPLRDDPSQFSYRVVVNAHPHEAHTSGKKAVHASEIVRNYRGSTKPGSEAIVLLLDNAIKLAASFNAKKAAKNGPQQHVESEDDISSWTSRVNRSLSEFAGFLERWNTFDVPFEDSLAKAIVAGKGAALAQVSASAQSASVHHRAAGVRASVAGSVPLRKSLHRPDGSSQQQQGLF